MEIAKKHLEGLTENMTFVSGESYWNDFMLISFCKHQLISNSTFSWWAAWLNANPDKIFVAPKDWFACNDDCDIVPDDWIVLENLKK